LVMRAAALADGRRVSDMGNPVEGPRESVNRLREANK
jgi:hypothetical protein